VSDQRDGPGWWLASDSKWYPPQPTTPPPPPAAARVAVTTVISDSQVLTPLTPDEAVARMVPLLTAGGAKVHAATSAAITGEVVTKVSASCLVAFVLLLIMILPGILYMIWGGKTISEPYSITLLPGPGGTTVTAAGQGRGAKAAQYAISNL
jgi:hypothetical protein